MTKFKISKKTQELLKGIVGFVMKAKDYKRYVDKL